MKKFKLIILAGIILSILVVSKYAVGDIEHIKVSNKMYEYLQQKDNRISVYNEAIVLNNNSSANTCVYFISEALRKIDISVPRETANTEQLLGILKEKGWKRDYDYTKLSPGDIVFTTDEFGNKKGIPSHTYVFMKWKEDGNYEEAYICDNQAKDYENKIYHIRNIKDIGKVKGISKDAFSFFMRPR